MRKIGLFLIIVVLLALVQETEQQECSRTHCEGRGRYKANCNCGCHNCCIRKYNCRGGYCGKARPPKRSKCFCYKCPKFEGFAPTRGSVNSTSKAG